MMKSKTNTDKVKSIVNLMIPWYQKNARDLPWRRKPYCDDPYCVYVSEIMLQQTQVKTVIPYWNHWMTALPTLQALAEAKPETVLKLWEGLGYYSRARNLQKGAQVVVKDFKGVFPENHSMMLTLPGIGRYTAGAIASIAFNQAQPILDGNVIRVLTRLHGIEGNPKDKSVNNELWNRAEELVVQAAALKPSNSRNSIPRCSHLNQSLMELGALICNPQQPRCGECPLKKECNAFDTGRTGTIPMRGEKPQPTPVFLVALVIRSGNHYLVHQREKNEVNGSLWEFPNFEIPENGYSPKMVQSLALKHLRLEIEEPVPKQVIKHSITRYRISLQVFHAKATSEIKPDPLPPAYQWSTTKALAKLPFTSAHKKILNQISPSPLKA